MVWQPKQLTRKQMAERRLEGYKKLRSGQHSQVELARMLGVSEAAVSQWKAKLKQEGMKGAKARRSRGRPTKISLEQRKKVLRLLKRGAMAVGFESERWTQKRIQKLIQREVGVQYHRDYVGRLLKVWGWSVQKPQSLPRERDEALIMAWLKQDWARIKKSTQNRG
jgi:putative transposase